MPFGTTNVHWVEDIAPLRLAVAARPRGGEWLGEEVSAWRTAGVDVVVSLLERHEARDLEIEDEGRLCAQAAIDFLSFPIPDRGTPASMRSARDVVDRLVERVRAHDGVLIHCRAGIGRTGLVGACVLHALGVRTDDVFDTLGRARGLRMPDTPEQVAWFEVYAQATSSSRPIAG